MHVLGIDTDLDRPDPDRHALDADPDPGKLCGSYSIQIHNTGKICLIFGDI
jgi:hypothetical protein